jgi:hypothetical protein
LYHAGLWAAIRAGWREGYTAEADHIIISGSNPEEIRRSIEAAKEAIRQAAGYTKFTTDTSRLFELRADPRHPEPWSDSVVAERFQTLFSPEEQRWILSEFAKPFHAGDRVYRLEARSQIRRLAVKFGASLRLNEELYDWIREVKATAPGVRTFDFEPSLDEAETLTTPEELLFYMHWLRARGRPAQLVPPNLGFKKRQAYPVAMESSPENGIGLRDYVKHKMWPELARGWNRNSAAGLWTSWARAWPNWPPWPVTSTPPSASTPAAASRQKCSARSDEPPPAASTTKFRASFNCNCSTC